MKLNDHDKLKIVDLLYRNPQESFDAIQMKWQNDTRDHNLDWHEYAEYLDFLNNSGFVKVVGINRDGMCQYRLDPDHSLSSFI